MDFPREHSFDEIGLRTTTLILDHREIKFEIAFSVKIKRQRVGCNTQISRD